jgi:hypothetical protein
MLPNCPWALVSFSISPVAGVQAPRCGFLFSSSWHTCRPWCFLRPLQMKFKMPTQPSRAICMCTIRLFSTITAFEALSSSMVTQALLVDQVIMMLTSMPGIIIICTLPLLARLFLEFYGRMRMVQRRSGTQNRWYVIHI